MFHDKGRDLNFFHSYLCTGLVRLCTNFALEMDLDYSFRITREVIGENLDCENYAILDVVITPNLHLSDPYDVAMRALHHMRSIMYEKIWQKNVFAGAVDIDQGTMRVVHHGFEANGDEFIWCEDDSVSPLTLRSIDFTKKFTCIYNTPPIAPMFGNLDPDTRCITPSPFKRRRFQ